MRLHAVRVVVATLLLAAAARPAAAARMRLEGYAEWRDGDALVVDGQRVVLAPRARVDVRGEARDWASIPLGYEMRVSGERAADGTVRARKVEARPNGSALFEPQVVARTVEAEEKYRRAGEFSRDEDGHVRVVGRLHDRGPQVERVRAIVDDILPPYVDPARVHVYVIDNREWNAFALGNFAIYVFSGLLDDLDDDELAIVLGHELAHATHEHTRRQFRKAMWIQLAALGVTLAAEEIDNKWHRAVADLLVEFGALAWVNGYGRDLEDQADRVGLRYAWEAGYDVTRGPALWERFSRRYGDGGRVASFFLADHTQSRVRATNLRRELALNYPAGRRPDGPAYAARRGPPSMPAEDALAADPMPAKAEESAALAAERRARVRPGMTPEEVRRILGRPDEVVVSRSRTRWAYPEATVVFESGRVAEVRF